MKTLIKHRITTRSLCNLALLVILLFTGCSAAAQPSTPTVSAWPSPDWHPSLPEQQGIDSGKLADMLEAVQAQKLNVHSVLIARRGALVLEAYANPYGPQDRHVVESNTKSVIGALIGIAIDQGLIKNTDQKLVSFFPERVIQNLDDRKKSITLHDLLSMQPGLDCQDQTPAAQGMYQTRVWVQYLLDLPMTAAPGKQWIYCSGAAHLLSEVIRQVSGMDARSYANRYLFGPLGIATVDERDWGADPQGVSNGVAGLYLTPRELARFGLLYLNQGQWNGKQIVSSAWVKKSTTEQAFIGNDPYVNGLNRRFGYMFSIFPDLGYYGYLGMAGQELFVLPKQNLVVLFNAGLEVGKEAALLDLINSYIVPAVQSSDAIGANGQNSARLAADLRAWKDPKGPAPALPQMALEVSGKVYRIEQNPWGWDQITFTFQPGSDEAQADVNGMPPLRIGMDSAYRLTDIPKSRPLGLRGHWQTPDTFVYEDITLGEYQKVMGKAKFSDDQITLTVQELNFGSQPVIVPGQRIH